MQARRNVMRAVLEKRRQVDTHMWVQLYLGIVFDFIHEEAVQEKPCFFLWIVSLSLSLCDSLCVPLHHVSKMCMLHAGSRRMATRAAMPILMEILRRK